MGLLDQALEQRLITPRQHRHIIEELNAFPGASVEELLVRKQFLTAAQVANLKQSPRPAAPGQPMQPAQPVRPVAAPPMRAPEPMRQPVQPAPAPSGPLPKTMIDFLRMARHWGASDMHISVGRPPFVRMRGEIRYLEAPPLTPEETEQLCFSVLTHSQQEQVRKAQNLDFSLDLGQAGRYRCNVFHQRLGWDGVFRIVPDTIPTFEQLGLPPVVQMLTDFHQGLVLVTGPARSGKTSTLAAMVDRINRQHPSHIITIEDPIEFVHRPLRAQITQREVGAHTQDFATALRAALREDPDIIMIGEMRDLETISIAISAAETGHLVLGTLHTSSASRTVSRILDVYPPSQREQIAVMVSESMRGVVSQLLLPRKDGRGLALALEVLVVTSGVSALIKEGKTHQLSSVMQSGRRQGMMLMDDSLMELMKSGVISGAEAFRHADNKAPFEAFKDSHQ